MIMITKFKLFENNFNCNFNYDGIEDIENYINMSCDVNAILSGDDTLAHEILYHNLDAPEYFPDKAHNIEDVDSLKLLFEYGFNLIDHKNKFDESILILASRTDDFDNIVVELGKDEYWILNTIIEAGADWFIKDADGKIFLDNLNEEEKEYIKNRYPEKWKDYLKKKTVKKFKI